uniref:Uncharacterized protein n=1 Tax=Anguilla anguilla TaxID=7936 RepID=A0A0E9PVL6_ANGAN
MCDAVRKAGDSSHIRIPSVRLGVAMTLSVLSSLFCNRLSFPPSTE